MQLRKESRLVWAKIFGYKEGQKVEIKVYYTPTIPAFIEKGTWIEGVIAKIEDRGKEFPKIFVRVEYPVAGKRCLYLVKENEIRPA